MSTDAPISSRRAVLGAALGRRGGRRRASARRAAVGGRGDRRPGPHRRRQHRRRDDELREHGRRTRPRSRPSTPAAARALEATSVDRPGDHGDLDGRHAVGPGHRPRSVAPQRRLRGRRRHERAPAPITDEAGVYGFADVSRVLGGRRRRVVPGRRRRSGSATPASFGFGASNGLFGIGAWGVYGTGDVGVVGDVNATGVGVYGFAGTSADPEPADRASASTPVPAPTASSPCASRAGRSSAAAGGSRSAARPRRSRWPGVERGEHVHRGDVPGGRRRASTCDRWSRQTARSRSTCRRSRPSR